MKEEDKTKLLKELLELYEDVVQEACSQMPTNSDNMLMLLILLQLTRIADTHEKFYQIIKDIARRPA
jgi:hypothetical protein